MKIPILLQDWDGKWKVESGKWKIPILEAPNLVVTPQIDKTAMLCMVTVFLSLI
jgi:hypothetical protein